MDSHVVRVELPNKALALVQSVGPLDQEVEKVGWTETFNLDDVSRSLEGIALAIRSGIAGAKPSKVSVVFGVDLTIKSGKLTSLIVDGESKGSIEVTLEWAGDDRGVERT